jgi:hypothetical protein
MSETTPPIHTSAFDWSFKGRHHISPLAHDLISTVEQLGGDRPSIGSAVIMSEVELLALNETIHGVQPDFGKPGVEITDDIRQRLATRLVYGALTVHEHASLLLGEPAEYESTLALGALARAIANPRELDKIIASAAKEGFIEAPTSNVTTDTTERDKFIGTITFVRNGKRIEGERYAPGKKNAARFAILDSLERIQGVAHSDVPELKFVTPLSPLSAVHGWFNHRGQAVPSFTNKEIARTQFTSETTCIIGDEERRFSVTGPGRRMADQICTYQIIDAIAQYEGQLAVPETQIKHQ